MKMIKTPFKWTQAITALIMANVLPAVGVVAWDWDLFAILFVYWLENGVIGVFTVLKMLTASPEMGQNKDPSVWCAWYRQAGRCRFNWLILAMVAFFIIHYGGFLYGHWQGLVMLFGDDLRSQMQQFRGQTGLLYTLAGLILSHGFSFARNYIGRGERKRMVVPILMFVPYRRVFGLHLIIMFVAGAVDLAGASRTGLLVLIVVKIVADVFAHMYERLYERESRSE
jgi:hypothetical protein